MVETPASATEDDTLPLTDAHLGADENFGHDVAQVRQHFDTAITSSGNVINIGALNLSARPRLSGVLSTATLDAALKHFVQPCGFGEALALLETERVVILSGPAGSGRRCGSYGLFKRVGMDSVVLLPPSMPLAELASRKFRDGRAYLAPDVEGLTEPSSEISWSRCRTNLAEAKSYLIVTRTVGHVDESRNLPTNVVWTQPEVGALAAAYLGDRETMDPVRRVLGSDAYRHVGVEDMTLFLADIRSGASIEEAAKRFDDGARSTVEQWLQKPRTVGELAEVLTAAFFPAQTQRDFESLLRQLVTRLSQVNAGALPPKEAGAGAVVIPHRRQRTVADSLIEVRRPAPHVSDMVVTLKTDAARVHVMAELARGFDRDFWDAVAGWLDAVVETHLDETALVLVAETLAILAMESPTEVLEAYLDPWADASSGSPQQRLAVYAVWWMVRSEHLSSLALSTGRRWITHGTAAQKWTAATAFSGDLGGAFPSEALRRIWSVVEMMPTRSRPARAALARLFAFLEDREAGSQLVIEHLEAEMARHNRPSRKQDTRNAVLAAALDVFTVTSGPNTTVTWIRAYSRSENVRAVTCRVWAALLRNQRYRSFAAAALIAGLKSLEASSNLQRAGEPTAAELSQSFGDTLLPLLRAADITALSARIANSMSGKQPDRSSSLVSALLDRCNSKPAQTAEAEI